MIIRFPSLFVTVLLLIVNLNLTKSAGACSYGLPGPVTYTPLDGATTVYEDYRAFVTSELGTLSWQEDEFSYQYDRHFRDRPKNFSNQYISVSQPPLKETVTKSPLKVEFLDNNTIYAGLAIYYETEAHLFDETRLSGVNVQEVCGGEQACCYDKTKVFGKIVEFEFGAGPISIDFSHRVIGEDGRYIFIVYTKLGDGKVKAVVSRTSKAYKLFGCRPSIVHFGFKKFEYYDLFCGITSANE